MSLPKSLAQLGNIMQLAYVPDDVDAALRYWTGLGVGPFFGIEHIKLTETKYRGVPTDIDFSIYIGYWGDMQIELVRQYNDAPSIFSSWTKAKRTGLHHVCLLVPDFEPVREIVARDGLTVAQSALVPGGGEVYYVQPDPADASSMVEILKPAPGTEAVFAMMRDAARDWDGSDPLRKLG